MALSFRHLFTSTKTDDPSDTTKVRPSNWNAEHTVTMATANLLGRTSSGTGAVEEIPTPLSITLGGTGSTTGLPALTASPAYVYLSQEGVVGDNSTDDTAALNAVFANLIGSGNATVVWDVGLCRTTGRVTVGDESGGAGASTSSVSIYCPYGVDQSGINYNGPTNDVALRFAKNKYFVCEGLGVYNQVAKGTTIGMQLGGAGSGSFGNQVLGSTFRNCRVGGFNVGITDGNFGACSEILWESLTLFSCDTGLVLNDFNSLDHIFVSLSMGEMGIGLDTGVSQGFHVYGGSSTNPSGTYEFAIRANSDNTMIANYRSELGPSFCHGTGGSVALINCEINDPVGHSSITGQYDRLTIDGCTIGGYINLVDCPSISVTNSTVRADLNSKTPLLHLQTVAQPLHISARNNNPNIYPPLPLPDFEGSLNRGPAYHLDRYQNPTVVDIRTFGADTLNLNLVRSLSETHPPLQYFTDTLVTTASTAAAGTVLTFASVPSWVIPNMVVTDVTTPAAITAFNSTRVVSTTATTVTVGNAVVAPGVGNGDTIQFVNWTPTVTPGKNLRVQGTFAASGTLNIAFERTLSGNGPGYQSNIVTAVTGNFFPADAGKAVEITGIFCFGNTAWWGHIDRYVDATHVTVIPADFQQAPYFAGAAPVNIGADEPDAAYMVVGLTSNAATPESYSVSNITASGFTVTSSNAASTATITALIVR